MQITNVNARGADLTIEPTNQHVKHGDTVDVPDAIGESLLRQVGEWERAESSETEGEQPAQTEQPAEAPAAEAHSEENQ